VLDVAGVVIFATLIWLTKRRSATDSPKAPVPLAD